MAHKKTPKNPKYAPWMGSRVSDDALCVSLDKLKLTEGERHVLEMGMAEVLADEKLAKTTRDYLMALAKAKGLFARTALKPKPATAPQTMNLGDPYSVRATEGTAFAEKVLANLPKRPPGMAA